MSSSDEDVPKCEDPGAKHEPHQCEPLDLSIRATRDASSRSGEPNISSLPVSKGCPSDCQPVGPSALSDPSHEDPYQRKILHMQDMWQKLYSKWRPEETHQDPYRRKTLCMQDMWQKLY
ncbi:hypothetical protein NPIL_33481 [Nephila pilipes]|uniref:Uncharacterized protein n=1 Tax=Nephila pilipes TaxID=299642 RepID=A0A8X6UQ65_NEPPI|nr:hypothetical protein NPIL_33481 [Nephila pilipes]